MGGFGDGEDGPPDLWDPDANATTGWHHGVQGLGRKEWNLLVVNDEKVVNAMAAPGAHINASLTDSNLNEHFTRHSRRLHRYTLCRDG